MAASPRFAWCLLYLTQDCLMVHLYTTEEKVYLVLRGTTVRVRKPDGTVVQHVMKRNVAIPGGAAVDQL